MRPSFTLHKTRRVQVAVGALTLMIPAAAYAATTNASAGPATAGAVPRFDLNRDHISYGLPVRAKGVTPAADAGKRVELQFAVPGGRWRTLATSRINRHGRFHFSARPQHSGLLRVAGAGGVIPAARTGGVVVPNVVPSSARYVSVRARFSVAQQVYNALGGHAVHVRGHLLPWVAGRRVVLQERSGRGWRNVARGRTGRSGGFDLRYSTGAGGTHALRVRFAGDALNTRATAPAGSVGVFSQSVASWYSDGGNTACGFHAFYGVANKTLPCGTKVTFQYGGRTVTATVDDRGPFVAGRTWDFNQNTAAALGMGGVATVWASY